MATAETPAHEVVDMDGELIDPTIVEWIIRNPISAVAVVGSYLEEDLVRLASPATGELIMSVSEMLRDAAHGLAFVGDTLADELGLKGNVPAPAPAPELGFI